MRDLEIRAGYAMIVALLCGMTWMAGREYAQHRHQRLWSARMEQARRKIERGGELLARAERLVGDRPETIYAASCPDGEPPPWVERQRAER